MVLLLIARNNFCAAAANIDEGGLLVAQMDGAGDPQVNQARFFASGDDAHSDAGFVAHSAQKFFLILGVAHRRSCYAEDFLRAIRTRQVGKFAADEHGAIHGFGLQVLIGKLAFAEADNFFLLGQRGVGMIGKNANQ